MLMPECDYSMFLYSFNQLRLLPEYPLLSSMIAEIGSSVFGTGMDENDMKLLRYSLHSPTPSQL